MQTSIIIENRHVTFFLYPIDSGYITHYEGHEIRIRRLPAPMGKSPTGNTKHYWTAMVGDYTSIPLSTRKAALTGAVNYINMQR